MDKQRIFKAIDGMIQELGLMQVELQRLKRIVLEETEQDKTPEPFTLPFKKPRED